MLQVTVTFTFDLLTSKSKGVIYGSWPTKTVIIGSLSLIVVNLWSGQGFYDPGYCDLDL